MIVSWIFIILLGAVAIAAFSKRFWQFGLLAGTAAVMAASNVILPFSALILVIFWVTWSICLLIAIFSAGYKPGVKAASFMTVVTLILLVVGTLVGIPRSPTVAQEINVATSDGETTTLPFADNRATTADDVKASTSEPLVGTQTVNETYASHSLKDSTAQLQSWSELYDRVNAADTATKNEYISAFNARADVLGVSWEQVPMLIAAEKAGVDTRVIQVVNSTVSDEQARNLVRADIGDKADELEIVRVSGAVVTTNGGVGSNVVVSDWVDGRSTVHPFLTVPQGITTIKPASATANTRTASVGVGVDPNCANVNTGVIQTPQPTPVKEQPTQPQDKPSTPATVPPTATTPPATTPPPTTPPATTPPPTTPPATTPPKSHPFPSGKPTNNPKPSGAPEATKAPETEPAQPSVKPSSVATQSAPGATAPATNQPVPSHVPTGAPTEGTSIGDPGPVPSVVIATPLITPEQVKADKAAADAIAQQAIAEAAAQAAVKQAAIDKAAADKLAVDQAAIDKAAADKVAADQQAAIDKAAADKVASDAIAAKAAADEIALKATNEQAAQKAAEDAKQAASAPAEPAETIVPLSSDGATNGLLLFPFAGLLLGLRRKAKTNSSKQRH